MGTLYIGIDPGKGGGIAAVDEKGAFVFVSKMPEDDATILRRLRFAKETGHQLQAAIEFVRSSPQMGVTSAFTFGRGYGALCMALEACSIPFFQVVPRKWQDAMDCRTGGDKNISKVAAQKLFPKVTVTHAFADALLIAEYARRVRQF